MNPKLILVVALALLLLVSTPAQGRDPAACTYSPAAPAPGEAVLFETADDAAIAWDLDDDGAFDDGEAHRATRAFAAGEHVVRMRARFTAGGESVATRTLQVGPAPPATTPTPTPTATPEATATPAPAVNQPPVARIATDCQPNDLCTGLFAREEQPHTIDGTPSSDPDGSIARYEWTFDGKTFEAGPSVTHSFTRYKVVEPGSARSSCG